MLCEYTSSLISSKNLKKHDYYTMNFYNKHFNKRIYRNFVITKTQKIRKIY